MSKKYLFAVLLTNIHDSRIDHVVVETQEDAEKIVLNKLKIKYKEI